LEQTAIKAEPDACLGGERNGLLRGGHRHLECVSLNDMEYLILAHCGRSYVLRRNEHVQESNTIIHDAVANEIERLCCFLNVQKPDSEKVQPWETLKAEKLKGSGEFRL
jgi:hypothetical protein